MWLHVSLHAATAIKNFQKLVTYISSSNMVPVMHAHRAGTGNTIPISGCGSTYSTQTVKHILEWWVWLHISFLSVYNCISTNPIELVTNSHMRFHLGISSEVDKTHLTQTKCDPNDPDNRMTQPTYNAGCDCFTRVSRFHCLSQMSYTQ